jgi:hypothetical protein
MIVCPRCNESNFHRSHRRRFDFFPRLLGMIALRCNLCEHRFFRPRRSILPSGSSKLRASAHVSAPH